MSEYLITESLLTGILCRHLNNNLVTLGYTVPGYTWLHLVTLLDLLSDFVILVTGAMF